MDTALLKKHITKYIHSIKSDKDAYEQDREERMERSKYYQGWTPEKLESMTEEQIYEFISKLWAMLIWGNKKYVVDKLISDNSFERLKQEISKLLWDEDPIEKRWDRFRSKIKGMGPAMMSEILCHVHPDQYVLREKGVKASFLTKT
jgi:hypothetical protein